MAVRSHSLKRLFTLVSIVGILDVICLLLYTPNPKEPLEIYSLPQGILHRQISSVGQSEQTAEIKPKYNLLEMLNLDLKEAVDRFNGSITIAKQYERVWQDPRRQAVDQDLSRDKDVHKVHHVQCLRSPFLLILVYSSPENFIDRQSIRLSWGKEENPINQGSWTRIESSWKTVFLVGKSNNFILDELVHHEAREYHDIVIGNFLDTFRNLSLKMVRGLEWAYKFCQPQYILKTDEDCYINTHSLIEWLKDYHFINRSKPLYLGRVQSAMSVVRNKNHRYFVSEKMHPSPTFLSYVSGGGYVFSASLLPRLLQATRRVERIPVEDASFGRYMDHIGIKPTNDNRFLPFILCEQSKQSLMDRQICSFQRPLVVHGVREILHIRMHYNVLLMTFIPTICSKVEEQPTKKRRKTHC